MPNRFRGLTKRKTTTTSIVEVRPSPVSDFDPSQCDDPKDIDKDGKRLSRSLRFNRGVFIYKDKKAMTLTVMCIATFFCSNAYFNNGHEYAWQAHPTVLGCYFTSEGSAILKVKRLAIHDEDRYPSKRTVEWSDKNEDSEKDLRNSRKYNRARAESFETDTCTLPYEWLSNSLPTCNNLHENDLTQFFNTGEQKIEERLLLLDHGFFRDIWTFKSQSGGSTFVLKTLRQVHELTERNFDRHRRDALLMEHLTSSNHVAQIYSYCGNSIFSEYATMGTVSDQIWPLSGGNSTLSSFERLKLSLKVAQAVNDAHIYDENGLATIAHTDITPSQFLVFNDGSVKINDFNRCRFLLRNKNGENCSYKVSHNPGKFRSVSCQLLYQGILFMLSLTLLIHSIVVHF